MAGREDGRGKREDESRGGDKGCEAIRPASPPNHQHSYYLVLIPIAHDNLSRRADTDRHRYCANSGLQHSSTVVEVVNCITGVCYCRQPKGYVREIVVLGASNPCS